MSSNEDLARIVAQEYAKLTLDKIQDYYKQTNQAIKDMTVSITNMADTIQKSSEQLARHEERESARVEQIKNIIEDLKELELRHEALEKEVIRRFEKAHTEIMKNSSARKVAIWFASILFAAMIAGGVLFGNITGKTPSPHTKYQEPRK